MGPRARPPGSSQTREPGRKARPSLGSLLLEFQSQKIRNGCLGDTAWYLLFPRSQKTTSAHCKGWPSWGTWVGNGGKEKGLEFAKPR